jgi:hypothetical protein
VIVQPIQQCEFAFPIARAVETHKSELHRRQLQEEPMPQSNHDRAAELHNLAAHAHAAAATAHGKGDHLTAHELSRQAHEHSVNAHKLAEDLAKDAPKSTRS